jgi:hypothetical protein
MAKTRKTLKTAKNKALHLYHKCAEEAGCLSSEKRKARRVRAKGTAKLKKGFKILLKNIRQEAQNKKKKKKNQSTMKLRSKK